MIAATGSVNANDRPEKIRSKVDVTIQYRRRYFEVDESEMAPMSGWAIRPEIGPASQTSEVSCSDKPKLRR